MSAIAAARGSSTGKMQFFALPINPAIAVSLLSSINEGNEQ
jgi:hypothetical protein